MLSQKRLGSCSQTKHLESRLSPHTCLHPCKPAARQFAHVHDTQIEHTLLSSPLRCAMSIIQKQKVALKAEVQEHVRSTCASGRFVHWKASPDVDRWLLDQQRAVYTEASFMESLKLHAKHPENSGREDAVGDAAAAGGKGLSGTASRSSSLDEPSSVVGQPLHQLRAAFPGFHALHSAMLNHISVSSAGRLGVFPSGQMIVRVKAG